MKTKNVMKVWTVAGVAALSMSIGLNACTDAKEQLQESTTKKEVFTEADKMPEYPGGFPALIQFIGEHLHYPETAESKGTAGTVLVGFVVDNTGKVTDVSIEKGVSAELDEAAVTVAKMMPNWTPGEKDGKTVNVKMVLPVKFELESMTGK